MAKDDFWDKLGKWYDPLGLHDYNGDGVHSWWEATDAEDSYYHEIREIERKRRKTKVSILDDDIDDDGNFIDDDYDEFDEESASGIQMYDKDGFEIDEYDPDGTYDEWGDKIDEFGDPVLFDDDKESDEDNTDTITITFSVGGGDEELSPEEEKKRDAKRHLESLSKAKKLDENDVIRKKRCELILKDDCVAARYTSIWGGFDIKEAIFAEFKLPKDYLDNYDIDDNLFVNLERIKDYDLDLIFKILRWLYAEFYPYRELDPKILESITSTVISFSQEDNEVNGKIYELVCQNHSFFAGAVSESTDAYGYHLTDILYEALSKGDIKIVEEFSLAVFKNENLKPMSKIDVFERLLTGDCIYELNTVAVKNYLQVIYPMLEIITNDVVKRKIDKIKQKIDEYLSSHEDELDDVDEDDEGDEEDTDETDNVPADDDWRKRCTYPNPYNVNPADFNSIMEFAAAYNKARENAAAQRKAAYEAEKREREKDDTIYELYGVCVQGMDRYYYYFAGNKKYNIGDDVIVPFGADNKKTIGTIVCIKKTKRKGIQCPIERIKTILYKVTAPDD